MTKFLALAIGALISSAAMAQDYGLALGIHQTTATADAVTGVTGSVSGKLGFDAGLLVSFELVPNVHFRTGALYDQRQFDYKMTAPVSGTYSYNFAYIDVPVNAQYNFNEMFGVFGGMIVGVKASDSTSAPAGFTANNPNMKSLYPLLNVGANFTFQDMIGFDVYYEQGLGDFADNVKNYSTFGLHFIYWL